MRRLRRWLFLSFLLLGSLVAFDQGVLHRGDAPAPSADASSEGGARSGSQETPKPKGEKKPKRASGPTSIVGAFGSPEACTAVLKAKPPRAAKAPARLGTWNVRWFPRGTMDGRDSTLNTDIAWLACAIATLDVDVLALQEILDNPDARAASVDLTTQLDALTQGDWHIELDECTGDGRQHVGLLWNRKRAEVDDVRSIEALNPTGSLCGSGLRPGFGAHVRFAAGVDAFVIVLHLDSGESERDWKHRTQSVDALARVLTPLRARDDDLIVLGDYNTMGCDRCEPKVTPEQELSAFDALLAAAQLTRVTPAPHACSHYYRGHAGLLDHIAVSPGLQPRARTEAFGLCAALACNKPPRGERILAWDTLSDHCPLVMELAQIRARGQASGR